MGRSRASSPAIFRVVTEMDAREVYILWDNEEAYLGRVDELCGESPRRNNPAGVSLPIFFQDMISSLAFATNESFPDTVKIIIR